MTDDGKGEARKRILLVVLPKEKIEFSRMLTVQKWMVRVKNMKIIQRF